MVLEISKGIEPGNLKITVLVSNTTSRTLATDDRFKGSVIQPESKYHRLLGEHGLAISIKFIEKGINHHILLDTGGLMNTIIKNSKNLEISLSDVEKVILSHGHYDHFGGLEKVIPEIRKKAEIYLNPICYEQNHVIISTTGEEISAEELTLSLNTMQKEGKLRRNSKLPLLNKVMIKKLANEHKIKIIETNKPEILHNGVVTSGEIEIFNNDEVTKGFYLTQKNNRFSKHTFRDETSLYINIKNRGLVILTGCAHTGLINTIKHGQKLTGINQVYAIIGGFHKERESYEKIEEVVTYLENLNPKITCGMHCTGFNFNKEMHRHSSHTLGIVGTEFNL